MPAQERLLPGHRHAQDQSQRPVLSAQPLQNGYQRILDILPAFISKAVQIVQHQEEAPIA